MPHIYWTASAQHLEEGGKEETVKHFLWQKLAKSWGALATRLT